jgi:hypothetical protein
MGGGCLGRFSQLPHTCRVMNVFANSPRPLEISRCPALLPCAAFSRERPVAGNSWWTCRRTGSGRDGSEKRVSRHRTRVRIPTRNVTTWNAADPGNCCVTAPSCAKIRSPDYSQWEVGASSSMCAAVDDGSRRRVCAQTRMARSCNEVSACQPAATAPSIQSGDDSGAAAAEPMMTRLSILASRARRSAGTPDA